MQDGDSIDLTGNNISYSLYFTKSDNVGVLGHQGVPLPFALEHTDGVFGLLLLCFLFFTHIYKGGFSFLKENALLIFSATRSQKIHRQTTTKEILYNYFLILQAVILISICLYDIFMRYTPVDKGTHTPLITILSFVLLISSYLFLKQLLYKFIGYMFDLGKLMQVWRNTYVVSIEMLGILYFIPTLLLVYSDSYHQVIIGFMLILFLIVQLILFSRIIIFFIREKFNFLFLIAYLCSVEILPYIYIYVGLVYLYRIDVFNLLWL